MTTLHKHTEITRKKPDEIGSAVTTARKTQQDWQRMKKASDGLVQANSELKENVQEFRHNLKRLDRVVTNLDMNLRSYSRNLEFARQRTLELGRKSRRLALIMGNYLESVDEDGKPKGDKNV